MIMHSKYSIFALALALVGCGQQHQPMTPVIGGQATAQPTNVQQAQQATAQQGYSGMEMAGGALGGYLLGRMTAPSQTITQPAQVIQKTVVIRDPVKPTPPVTTQQRVVNSAPVATQTNRVVTGSNRSFSYRSSSSGRRR